MTTISFTHATPPQRQAASAVGRRTSGVWVGWSWEYSSNVGSKLLSTVHSGDNWGMKLPLRYFLIISILLGAVAIPVGWRSYQKWKDQRLQAEVERLEKATQRRVVAVTGAHGTGTTFHPERRTGRNSAFETCNIASF